MFGTKFSILMTNNTLSKASFFFVHLIVYKGEKQWKIQENVFAL